MYVRFCLNDSSCCCQLAAAERDDIGAAVGSSGLTAGDVAGTLDAEYSVITCHQMKISSASGTSVIMIISGLAPSSSGIGGISTSSCVVVMPRDMRWDAVRLAGRFAERLLDDLRADAIVLRTIHSHE
jgi:hypothetical protein